MKKFKKTFILILITIIVIGIAIYQKISSSEYEEIESDDLTALNYNNIEELPEEKSYIILHITGEILNPGIVKIEEGARVSDVIEAAGGLTPDADLNRINLAYIVADGQKIYIPSIYDEEQEVYITNDIGKNIIDESFSIKTSDKVNINTATLTELEMLTGIGPSTALKIIEYRKTNGSFKSIEEIKNVPGIGESKFNAIKDEICVWNKMS